MQHFTAVACLRKEFMEKRGFVPICNTLLMYFILKKCHRKYDMKLFPASQSADSS